ncbi:MAG: hypothetical protein WC732_08665 [Candidatus Omnitrophota bacterium]
MSEADKDATMTQLPAAAKPRVGKSRTKRADAAASGADGVDAAPAAPAAWGTDAPGMIDDEMREAAQQKPAPAAVAVEPPTATPPPQEKRPASSTVSAADCEAMRALYTPFFEGSAGFYVGVF